MKQEPLTPSTKPGVLTTIPVAAGTSKKLSQSAARTHGKKDESQDPLLITNRSEDISQFENQFLVQTFKKIDLA